MVTVTRAGEGVTIPGDPLCATRPPSVCGAALRWAWRLCLRSVRLADWQAGCTALIGRSGRCVPSVSVCVR